VQATAFMLRRFAPTNFQDDFPLETNAQRQRNQADLSACPEHLGTGKFTLERGGKIVRSEALMGAGGGLSFGSERRIVLL
jgi:hypothetical protein